MKLTFLGAAQTVTGSKYLVEYNNKKILVDCGLFQGTKDSRLLNWQALPIDVRNIDAVLLTHAHIDHSGYIPLLVKNGFKGKIFCSEATFELCKILLPDSGFLQEEDAFQANHYGYTKHKTALPLYTEADARRCLNSFETINFGEPHYFADDFYFVLSRSGHILGSSFIQIFAGKKNILFSGDLGRPQDPLMPKPAQMQYADYLVLESTYGNRLHSKIDPEAEIQKVVNTTAARGGVVVIPAFAVGRAQNILYYLYQLKQKNLIPNLPIFVDSPMAIDASEILLRFSNEHKLGKKICVEMCKIAKYLRTTEESKKLNSMKVPMVIISASGMAEGGRVLHHLKNYIQDHKNTILFSGFQAPDTRGDKILRGEKQIKIHGNFFDVNAEIINLSNSSAHADYEEILQWLQEFKAAPKKVFITHGNIESAISLKEKIIEKLNWNVEVPKYLQSEKL